MNALTYSFSFRVNLRFVRVGLLQYSQHCLCKILVEKSHYIGIVCQSGNFFEKIEATNPILLRIWSSHRHDCKISETRIGFLCQRTDRPFFLVRFFEKKLLAFVQLSTDNIDFCIISLSDNAITINSRKYFCASDTENCRYDVK